MGSRKSVVISKSNSISRSNSIVRTTAPILVSFLFIGSCSAANAERSVTSHPTHHQQTNHKALEPYGFSKDRVEDVNAGSKFSDDWTKPQFQESCRHFDDCNFDQSMKFVKDKIATGKEKARTSYQNPPDRSECLFAFGEALHSMQDFITHSNFLEWHLDKNLKIPDVLIKDLEELIQSKNFKSGFLTDKEVALVKQQSPQENQVKGKDFLHWFQDNKLHGKELQTDKFHTQPQFNERFNSTGKPSFKTAVNYVLDEKDLLRYELNKERPSDAQGCVVVASKDKRYNGKTLHQLAAESATNMTKKCWESIENEIWRDEDTACLQLAALKGQPLPALQLRLGAPKLNESSETLGGTCTVTIKNFPKDCPVPIKVRVKITLKPGDSSVEREMKFQKNASQSLSLKSLNFPKGSFNGKTEISAEASWVGAEKFESSKETCALSN